MDMDRLVKAVKRHSGMTPDEIVQAGEHGADAGWPGFTYTVDTNRFYDRHADLIWELLAEQADEFGEKHPLALIAKFNSAHSVDTDHGFKNLLAWYALEEAGHYLAAEEEA